MNRTLTCVLLICCALFCEEARASTVTYTIAFVAGPDSLNDFGPFSGEVNASGSFTVTFDPTASYTDASSGIVTNYLNVNGQALSVAPAFDYFPQQNELAIGGVPNGVASFGVGDFIAIFTVSQSGSPQFTGFDAQLTVGGPVYVTSNGAVVPATSVTPEPSSIALLSTGIVCLLCTGTRRFFRRQRPYPARTISGPENSSSYSLVRKDADDLRQHRLFA